MKQRVVIILCALLLVPNVVLAQAAVSRVDPTEYILTREAEVKNKVGKLLLSATLGGLMESFSYFTRKLAYDTAKYISSGGTGQGALIFQDGFDKYISRTAKDAVGQFVYELGSPFGLDLCSVPDPRFNVWLRLSLLNVYGQGGPQNDCSWTELSEGWTWEEVQKKYDFRDGRSLDQALIEEFRKSLIVNDGEFGLVMDGVFGIEQFVHDAEDVALFEREEGKGFRPVESLISGDIKTPSDIVRYETYKLTAKDNADLTAGQIAGIYSAGLEGLIPQAASVFLNTLTSDLLQKLLTTEGGGLIGRTTDANVTDEFAASVGDRRIAAEQAFNFLLTGTATREINAYDTQLLSQFASCPSPAGIYNCVIDPGLQKAIQRGMTAEPLTIQQAIDEGLLRSDWPLISPDDVLRNGSTNCYQQGYCYSNLQKLRKARILPLGFEIAATLGSPDDPNRVTLGDVVAGFRDCAFDGSGRAYRDNAHPYCHLIDPNWIIKMPAAICEVFAHNELPLFNQSADRQESCADLASCVRTDDQGNCLSYGYCLQEENTWTIPGRSCEAQFSTCQTFVSERTGEQAAYLTRTLDAGLCDADMVGCRPFSAIRNADDTWVNVDTLTSSQVRTAIEQKRYGNNTVYHFNDNIFDQGRTCDASAAGCTLVEVATLNGSVYERGNTRTQIQLAPAYLGCYDQNQDSTDGIQAPTTITEAETIRLTNESCGDYAPVCVESEVGCNMWTPATGGAPIPGQIAGNTCDANCVGYDTYRQLATPFDPIAVADRSFIPANGEQCRAEYVGCSEFTNLEARSQGGEQVEYYSAVTYCQTPEEANEQTFYTWEGSRTEGFVLRVHRLAAYTETDADRLYYSGVFATESEAVQSLFVAGGPVYAARSTEALRRLGSACNADTYDLRVAEGAVSGAASETCREFFDDAGNSYYRDITEIIIVTNQCVRLRKTDTVLEVDPYLTADGETACTDRGGYWAVNEQADIESGFGGHGGDLFDVDSSVCNVCPGGGVYEGGACIYRNLRGGGSTCPASANECRAYVGATGANIRSLVLGTFDTGTADGWSAGSIVDESIFVGKQSLQVTGSVSRTISSDQIATDLSAVSFEVRFWARGVAQPVSMQITQGDTTVIPLGTVQIGDVWKEYRLGPITIDAFNSSDDISIEWNRSGTGNYFLDTVELRRTTDYAYLIKDSWQITETGADGSPIRVDAPLVCDADPFDAFPGSGLGCERYTNQSNEVAFATGFAQLCREAAIGCRPLYNTYNTPEVEEVWYQVKCTAESTDLVRSEKTYATSSGLCELVYEGEVLGSCTVIPGESHCYIPKVVWPDTFTAADSAYDTYTDLFVSLSTIVAPADTPEATPLFISVQEDYACNARDIGCTALGQQQGTTFSDVYLINHPKDYVVGETAVLCTEDGIGCEAYQANGSVQYFKNPEIQGNAFCEYRTNVAINGTPRDGWFKQGVGLCANDTTTECRVDADCGSGSCNLSLPVACYPGQINAQNEFAILSNATPLYAGHVGVCPLDQNQCTELIDRYDTSPVYPNGTPHYVIFDDTLRTQSGQCGGEASLREGCILLDRTDTPNKLYDTAATYAASQQKPGDQYGSVVPVVNDATNDANIIMHVTRDRQCAEWLACRQEQKSFDNNGNVVSVCTAFGRCIEADSSGQCTKFLPPDAVGVCSNDREMSCFDDVDCVGGGFCTYQSGKLTTASYVARDTSWYGTDYSGYSLHNGYNYTNFSYLTLYPNDFVQYLAYEVPDSVFTYDDGVYQDASCWVYNGSVIDGIKPDWATCGVSSEGRCFEGSCIVPVTGNFPAQLTPSYRGEAPYETPTDLAAAVLTGADCKVYPEPDAPFPPQVVSGFDPVSIVDGSPVESVVSSNAFTYNRFAYEFVQKRSDFQGVNIYQDLAVNHKGEDNPYIGADRPYVSSCVYTKVTFQNGAEDYWPFAASTIPGVCSSQSTQSEVWGKPCGSNNDCVADTNGNGTGDEIDDPSIIGQCALVTAKQTHIGTEGFCLQRDLSTPVNGGVTRDDFACLIWLPIQSSVSRFDVYNSDPKAGYVPFDEYDAPDQGDGGQLYCLGTQDLARGVVNSTNYSVNIAVDTSQGTPYSVCGQSQLIACTSNPAQFEFDDLNECYDEYDSCKIYLEEEDLTRFIPMNYSPEQALDLGPYVTFDDGSGYKRLSDDIFNYYFDLGFESARENWRTRVLAEADILFGEVYQEEIERFGAAQNSGLAQVIIRIDPCNLPSLNPVLNFIAHDGRFDVGGLELTPGALTCGGSRSLQFPNTGLYLENPVGNLYPPNSLRYWSVDIVYSNQQFGVIQGDDIPYRFTRTDDGLVRFINQNRNYPEAYMRYEEAPEIEINELSGESTCDAYHFAGSGVPLLACKAATFFDTDPDSLFGDPEPDPDTVDNANARCTDISSNGLYQEAVCGYGNSIQAGTRSLYEVIQTWAWDFATRAFPTETVPEPNRPRNAYVLRLEHASLQNIPRETSGGWTYRSSIEPFYATFDSVEEGLDASPYRFGYLYPANDNSFDPAVYSLLPEHAWFDAGGAPGRAPQNGRVFMHPPRVWSADGTRTNTGYTHRSDATSDSLSAEQVVDSPLQDLVYTSSFQESLSESQIDRIYFVPMRIPGGASAISPTIMSRGLYIDFPEVRANENSVRINEIPQATTVGREFPTSGSTGSGRTITYRLDRSDASTEGECGGLLTNCYADTGVTVDPRNEIASRYVLVFTYDCDGENPEEEDCDAPPIYDKPTTPEEDPFGGLECRMGSSRFGKQDGSWFAIGMNFNADGEFLGYISRNCVIPSFGAIPNYSHGYQLAVIGVLAPLCEEFAQVFDGDADAQVIGTTNKAWTDRVWRYSENTYQPFAEVSLETKNQPFGSLLATYDTINTAARARYGFVDEAAGVPILCHYTETLPNNAQLLFSPLLSCASLPSGVPSVAYRTYYDIVQQAFFRDEPIPQAARSDGTSNVADSYASYENIAGDLSNSISYTGYANGATFSDTNTRMYAMQTLQQLFAKVYGVVSRDLTDTIETDERGPSNTAIYYDVSGDVSAGLLPPQIYAVHPDACSTSLFGGLLSGDDIFADGDCGPGPRQTMTINGYTGSVTVDFDRDGRPDEDQNGNGVWDGMPVAVGQLFVNMKFFAFADHNRMPIREIKVDWNDNTSKRVQKIGYYKNAKPYCSTGAIKECGTSQLTCETNQDCIDAGLTGSNATCTDQPARFGNQSDRSCTESYYEHSYTYVCDRARATLNISDIPSVDVRQKLYAVTNNQDTPVCAFNPRVQIVDNWGWCNTADGVGAYNDSNGFLGCDFGNSNVWDYFDQPIYVLLDTPLVN